jgi:hypothetical protein
MQDLTTQTVSTDTQTTESMPWSLHKNIMLLWARSDLIFKDRYAAQRMYH